MGLAIESRQRVTAPSPGHSQNQSLHTQAQCAAHQMLLPQLWGASVQSAILPKTDSTVPHLPGPEGSHAAQSIPDGGSGHQPCPGRSQAGVLSPGEQPSRAQSIREPGEPAGPWWQQHKQLQESKTLPLCPLSPSRPESRLEKAYAGGGWRLGRPDRATAPRSGTVRTELEQEAGGSTHPTLAHVSEKCSSISEPPCLDRTTHEN